MKTKLVLLSMCLSFAAHAREQASLSWLKMIEFPVLGVELLQKRFVEEEAGAYVNRSLEITVGINTRAYDCVKSFEVKIISGQTSLDDSLNPTDLYLKLISKEDECRALAGWGQERKVQYTQKFYIDQWRKSEPTPPLPELKYGKIHHFSFDIGMLGGFDRWGMYKLDYSDLENITFEHVKNYTYVQGTVQEQ